MDFIKPILEKYMTECHWFGDVLRHGFIEFESVEVDGFMLVAQRDIGPLSIRSRVN